MSDKTQCWICFCYSDWQEREDSPRQLQGYFYLRIQSQLKVEFVHILQSLAKLGQKNQDFWMWFCDHSYSVAPYCWYSLYFSWSLTSFCKEYPYPHSCPESLCFRIWLCLILISLFLHLFQRWLSWDEQFRVDKTPGHSGITPWSKAWCIQEFWLSARRGKDFLHRWHQSLARMHHWFSLTSCYFVSY